MTNPQQGPPSPGYMGPPQGAYAGAGAGAGGRAGLQQNMDAILGVLGVAGFFLGFGRFSTTELTGGLPSQLRDQLPDTGVSFFQAGFGWLPALLLLAGAAVLVSRVSGQQWGIGAAGALSATVVVTMLCNLQLFPEGYSTGWGYWTIFAVAVIMAGLAVWSVLPSAGSGGGTQGWSAGRAPYAPHQPQWGQPQWGPQPGQPQWGGQPTGQPGQPQWGQAPGRPGGPQPQGPQPQSQQPQNQQQSQQGWGQPPAYGQGGPPQYAPGAPGAAPGQQTPGGQPYGAPPGQAAGSAPDYGAREYQRGSSAGSSAQGSASGGSQWQGSGYPAGGTTGRAEQSGQGDEGENDVTRSTRPGESGRGTGAD